MDRFLNQILPIGSIVKLKNDDKNKIIVGYCSNDIEDDIKLYSGVEYPIGLRKKLKLNSNYFLFNQEDIEEVLFVGHQDSEYLEYSKIIMKITLYKEKKIKYDSKTLLQDLLREDLKIIKYRESNNE